MAQTDDNRLDKAGTVSHRPFGKDAARIMAAARTMASKTAHDLNGFLTTIAYSIELAMEDITDETVREDLERVLETAHEASRYLNDLTFFCKPSGKGFTETDVKALGREIAGHFKAGMPETMDFHLEIDPNLGRAVIDPGQISRIALELLNNAAASTRAMNGRIRLSMKTGTMPDKGDITCLHLSVSDNGPGLPPDIMERIFQPMHTKGYNSKGMGLANVYSLVENHDGLIRVSSEPFKETVFDIFIPVLRQEGRT
jgi:signal transduction histidine kinase